MGVRIEPGDASIRTLADEARQGGHLVARSKGYTNFAVALAAASICESIDEDARTVLPVSTHVEGFRGLGDVCLSLPCVVGRNGVERILAIDLDDEETVLLRRSADPIRKIIDDVERAAAG